MFSHLLNLTMAQNILEELKKTENETDELLNSAEKKKLQIIDDAKNTASKIISMREKEALNLKQHAIDSGNEKINSAKSKINAEGMQKVQELEKAASKKKQKAVETMLSKFEALIK